MQVDLITWAITEIRELDELCRSMVPGYMPLDSDDVERLRGLEKLAATLTEPEPTDEDD